MSTKNSISIGSIFRRSSCLKSINESNSTLVQLECDRLGKMIDTIRETEKVPDNFDSILKSFSEDISTTESSNKYFRNLLACAEVLNPVDDKRANNTIKILCNSVIPYMKDLSYMDEAVSRYNLTDKQYESIKETVKTINVSDRIIKNHENIIKRFPNIVEKVTTMSKGRNLSSVCETVCDMIDNYSIESYQKVNLSIEEICYIYERYGLDDNISRVNIAENVLGYFLLRDSKIRSLKGYEIAIKENCFLLDEDVVNPKVNYLKVSYDEDTSVRKEIQIFRVSSVKNLDLMNRFINNILTLVPVKDIVRDMNVLLSFLWEVYRADIITDINEAYEGYFAQLAGLIDDKAMDTDIDIEDVNRVLDAIKSVDNSIIIGYEDEYSYNMKVVKFKSFLTTFKNEILNTKNTLYSKENVAAIAACNNYNDNEPYIKVYEPVGLGGIKYASRYILKTINDQINGYPGNNMPQRIHDLLVNKMHVLYKEENNDIYSYLGADKRLDCAVAIFSGSESDLLLLKDYIEKICKDANNAFYNFFRPGKNKESMYPIRAYYIINPGLGDISLHVKDPVVLTMSDEDLDKIDNLNTDEMEPFIETFALAEAAIMDFENFCESNNIESIETFIENYNNINISQEQYEVAMECLSLFDVEMETVDYFTEKTKSLMYDSLIENNLVTESSSYDINKSIDSIRNDWVHESDVPMEIQFEAFEIFYKCLTEAPDVKKIKVGGAAVKSGVDKKKPTTIDKKSTTDDKKNKDTKDKDGKKFDEKNPFDGINLNNMKLYLEGLKAKMKDMSQKEKELSRNLDNTFRLLVKAMKNALVSDRREAIIKGSVIPSFSRCIKACIGLAGVYAVSGFNPAAPLLVAFGGFCVSKRLTQKERLLLLDEIETELQVVDKEISMAESRDNMKKYRALLKYKKDLQRQYQRIKYNIRVGKDILPNSAAGLRNQD